jgi:hypothetical protein
MLHYFKHNLNPIQHGFLKARSKTTILVTYLYFTSLLALNVKYSIYFDLNGTFDLVSHPFYSPNFAHMDSGSYMNWFHS